jgi:hypothetical protein
MWRSFRHMPGRYRNVYYQGKTWRVCEVPEWRFTLVMPSSGSPCEAVRV